MAANRLRRWAISLSSYTYNIQYKPTTKHGNADTLSRLPIAADQQVQKHCCLTLQLDLIHSVQLKQIPLETAESHKIRHSSISSLPFHTEWMAET